MITIRKAEANDVGPIATCLLLAMEDIVYRFIGKRDPTMAADFMRHFIAGQNNQYSYQNCWVAASGQQVAGVACLYNGADLSRLRQPVLEYLSSHYGQHLQPEDETSAGEYYIDTLGVLPAWQGKGVGTLLLQFLIDEYTLQQGHTLGLLVDEDNPAAKKLYLKLGFKTAGNKTLVGKRMEHLQYKA